MTELTDYMEALNWSELSDWDRCAATGRLRDQVLELHNNGRPTPESRRMSEFVCQLEFARLKEKQLSTRLSDSFLMERARHFSLLVMRPPEFADHV